MMGAHDDEIRNVAEHNIEQGSANGMIEKQSSDNTHFESVSEKVVGTSGQIIREAKMLCDGAFGASRNGNFSDAVELFSQALELLATELGQFDEVLGPIYIGYGRALLQVAIERIDLVNKSVVSDEFGQDESVLLQPLDAKNRRKLIDIPNIFEEDEQEEKQANTEVEPQNMVASFEAKQGEQGESEQEEEEEEYEGVEGGEEGYEEYEGGGEEGEGITDQDDLQLAWEVLDIARIIYTKSATDCAKIILADISMDLGDVSMESENFVQAQSEFSTAIALLERYDPTNLRTQSAANFKLGMAYEYMNDIKSAIHPIQKAQELLLCRIENLEKQSQTNCSDKGKEKVAKEDTEILELQQLLPAIQSKLGELKELLEKESNVIMENGGATANLNDPSDHHQESFELDASSAPVNDLSGLVKKRKVNVIEK